MQHDLSGLFMIVLDYGSEGITLFHISFDNLYCVFDFYELFVEIFQLLNKLLISFWNHNPEGFLKLFQGGDKSADQTLSKINDIVPQDLIFFFSFCLELDQGISYWISDWLQIIEFIVYLS